MKLLNSVDSASRNELRELNELNFARFDAKLEHRIAELRVYVERALKEQTRWFIASWAVQLAAIGGLYALVLATR
jgi:hypothetical protein